MPLPPHVVPRLPLQIHMKSCFGPCSPASLLKNKPQEPLRHQKGSRWSKYKYILVQQILQFLVKSPHHSIWCMSLYKYDLVVIFCPFVISFTAYLFLLFPFATSPKGKRSLGFCRFLSHTGVGGMGLCG